MRITPVQIRNENQAQKLMNSIGVSREGARLLVPKSLHSAFLIDGIKSWEANIIKQSLLSLGTDAAIDRNALIKEKKTAAFIFGSKGQLYKLCQKLRDQPFNLRKISRDLALYLDNLSKENFTFSARGKVLTIKKPLICGIINMTPDSFSGDGFLSNSGALKTESSLLKKVEAMLKCGVKMVDVGGESSRPFSKGISAEEEIKRVIPAIRLLRRRFKNILISVDTYKFEVAKAALENGVDIINDISALRKSSRIVSLVKKYRAGLILMHMKGTPQTMQVNPVYKDVMEDIVTFFEERLDFCEKRGIDRKQILIDPGIGFGKRLEDNIKIINELYKLKMLGLPIFIGLSRKSFIGKVLKRGVNARLAGTVAANIIALMRGASILRVHDVAETAQTIRMVSKITNN